jgi:HEAT repeat protein
MALTALHQMGTNGTPSLLAAAQDPSHPYRNDAIYLLGISLDLNGHEDAVVSYFLFALKNPAVNYAAASALGSLGLRPEIVVPELASFLQDTNSQRRFRSAVVVSLLYFGEKAASALPQLTNAASDPDAEVRSQTTNAITQIQLAIRRAETK